ncbi:SigE family RNA polymerase sigma factor [Nocardioides sp.]|uniref:SigE family RNA polymerase sigma factor n=1 Tax=Nocardioides sp. TaxID=35761 RepID=UPI002718760C|nr:SigE family RNA polymerase sigma factor [Nocardioides sp.]MDO9455835.1 SigE family RNA polymerase sigma factor [Nocardioides sp.]
MRPDQTADFEEFVAGSARSLRRTAYLLCGDWQRAEDAAQDALVKVYVAWPRIRRRGSAHAYAHRAVATAVVDQSRRPWRREVATETLPEGRVDPMAPTERRLAVLAALRELPDRRRACVVLRYFADLSVADTATALGIDGGTVKSQTARALDQLRVSLADTGLDLATEDL